MWQSLQEESHCFLSMVGWCWEEAAVILHVSPHCSSHTPGKQTSKAGAPAAMGGLFLHMKNDKSLTFISDPEFS